ncbi:MAG TPA: hypothetical protein VHE61_03025, partial [Opitutaceae bacterium]|nr:hypothetical protein [Opitutaceae bacterium]
MRGKPVLLRENSGSVLRPSRGFQKKLLCDGLVLNLGDTCVYNCEFCYVEGMLKGPLGFPRKTLDNFNAVTGATHGFRDVVIRRRNSLELLKNQLLTKNGTPRKEFSQSGDVVFSSSLVDVAANMELAEETARACRLILEHTKLQIRLLSKSNLLTQIVTNKRFRIPDKYRDRVIFGFSTGTLYDGVAKAIETGTAPVSVRIK